MLQSNSYVNFSLEFDEAYRIQSNKGMYDVSDVACKFLVHSDVSIGEIVPCFCTEIGVRL